LSIETIDILPGPCSGACLFLSSNTYFLSKRLFEFLVLGPEEEIKQKVN